MPYQQQTKGIFITSVLEDIPYGFTIPKGYYADQNISGKVINGCITIYNDNDQIFARLSYKNSKLNGQCFFYKNNIPIELIAYEEDVRRVKAILYDIINAEELILRDPEPFAAVSEHADSSVNFVIKAWTKTENY